MTVKNIFTINYDSSELFKIKKGNFDSLVDEFGISRASRLSETVIQSICCLESLGFKSFELIEDCEMLVKAEIWQFYEQVESAIIRFIESDGDCSIIDNLVGQEVELDYSDDELIHIVKPDYEVDEHTRNVSDCVWTYFRRMPLSKLMSEYIISAIVIEKSAKYLFAYSIHLAVRWLGLSLILSSSLRHDSGIDEIILCSSKGLAYADSHIMNLTSLKVLNEFNAEALVERSKQSKFNRERDSFTPIITDKLIESNGQIAPSQMFDLLYATRPEIIMGGHKAGRIEVKGRGSSRVVSYAGVDYDKKGITAKTKKIIKKLGF